MTYTPKILAFAGSTRTGSYNKKLIKIAADAARQGGAQVTLIDLRDFPLPLYDGDLEAQGVPENVHKLKKIFLEHDGLLIASPEYNGSVSGVLKNTIDWISRKTTADEPPLSAYRNKVAALLSASPGGFGGLRSLVTLRAVLSHINVLVIPSQVTISKADEAFDTQGNLKDAKQNEAVRKLTADLVDLLKKLKI
jgi:chromate reductase, NAD(P)H dehydrogenase (quinone)